LIIKSFPDKQDFPLTMRLKRVVYILIKQFHEIQVRFRLDVLQNVGLQSPVGSHTHGVPFSLTIFVVHQVRDLLVDVDQTVGTRGQHLVAASVSCGEYVATTLSCDGYPGQITSTDVFGDMIIAIGRLSTEKPQLIGAGTFVQGNSEPPTPPLPVSLSFMLEGLEILSIATWTMRIQW
jgi:hypothetical protein